MIAANRTSMPPRKPRNLCGTIMAISDISKAELSISRTSSTKRQACWPWKRFLRCMKRPRIQSGLIAQKSPLIMRKPTSKSGTFPCPRMPSTARSIGNAVFPRPACKASPPAVAQEVVAMNSWIGRRPPTPSSTNTPAISTTSTSREFSCTTRRRCSHFPAARSIWPAPVGNRNIGATAASPIIARGCRGFPRITCGALPVWKRPAAICSTRL